MSSESQTNGQIAPDVAASLPYSWLILGLGFAGLFAAAVLSVVVLFRFLELRPVNLRQETDTLAETIEEVLVSNLVPPDKIHREPAKLAVDDTQRAVWRHYGLKTEIPPSLSLEGMEEVLRRTMAKHNVMVTTLAVSDNSRELTFYLGKFRFATMQMTAAAETRNRADLRGATTKLGQQAVNRLIASGLTVAAPAPVEQEDDAAQWTRTEFQVQLPPGFSIDNITAELVETLSGDQIETAREAGPRGSTLVRSSYAGRPCLALTLVAAAVETPEAAASKPLLKLADAIRELNLDEILSIALPKPDEIELESAGVEENGVSSSEPTPEPESSPTLPAAPVAESPAMPPTAKRVAIIVDDGGYGGPVTEKILALDAHLTLAILPNTPEAKETAARAKEKGFEILLHMPMEKANFPGRISTDMNGAQVRQLTEDALNQVPGAVGVNNHAGSVYTANEEAMKRFLEVIKEHPLFFIDSRTTANTKAYDVAKSMGIRTGKRNVFLDHENSVAYIRTQFERLLHVVETNGSAIAICHFRPHTAKVLSEMLPKLAENGIALVHVSELVQ